MGLYHNIRVVNRPGPGIANIEFDGDVYLWATAKLRAEKRGPERKCPECGRHLLAGETAYRPMGNKAYRYQRMCVPCVED